LTLERKERSRYEREATQRLEGLQMKMESMLKQRESEIREELETKIRTNKHKHSQELQRIHEIIRDREQALDQTEKQLEALHIEKSAAELQLQKAEVE
jgi:hypothetical protein